MILALLVALPISVAWQFLRVSWRLVQRCAQSFVTYGTRSLADDTKVHKNQMSDQTLLSVPLLSIHLIENIRLNFFPLVGGPKCLQWRIS
jgi:hypothetical protein